MYTIHYGITAINAYHNTTAPFEMRTSSRSEVRGFLARVAACPDAYGLDRITVSTASGERVLEPAEV